MELWIDRYVEGLSSAEYHLQLLIISIMLGFIAYKTLKTYQRFRFIGDTATSRIASAAQGYVELKGLGEMIPGPAIISPFSQRRCLWYQCITEKRKRIKSHNVWVEENNDLSDNLFELQDETGNCIVNPEGAFVIPSQKPVWYGSYTQARFQGVIKSSWFNRYIGFGRYRFTEKLIFVADPVYVIGLFTSTQKVISAESLKSKVEDLLKQWKAKPAYYLTRFDMDKNGKIQGQEWKRIRQYAEQLIREQQHTQLHVMQKSQESSNQPFVISTQSEAQMLKQKRLWLLANSALFFMLFYVLLLFIK